MSTPAPSGFAAVLSKLNAALGGSPNDPSNTALMGFAAGLGQASAPHMLTPVSGGQALSMGAQASQAYQQRALQNAMLSETVPFQGMKVAAFRNAWATMANPNASPQDKATAKAILANLVSPGIGPSIIANSPAIQGPKEAAISQNKPTSVGPGVRVYGPTGTQSVGAQGALPEGTAQPLGSLDLRFLPGAPGAIAANAYNQAGGAAAGAYPVHAALSWHVRPPGSAGGTLGAPPGPFVPMGAPPASPAAIAAARQRQIGTMQGLSQAAQASGVPAPFNPMGQQPPPSSGALGPNPSAPGTPASLREIGKTPAGRAHAAAVLRAANARPLLTLSRPQQPGTGNGIFSPGMSAAAYAAAKSVGNQTGAAVGEAAHVSDAARQQIALYDQMGQSLSQMGGTGAWRDVSTPLGKLFNYFGFKPFNITSAAEFAKYRSQLVGAATHAVSPRASTQEMDFLAQSVPNYNLPGNAAQTLVSELRGLSQYQVLKSNALPVYLQTIASQQGGNFKGTSLGFDRWWVSNGPSPSAIVIGSVVTHLPPQQRAAYVKRLQSTVTGRIMLEQYARARAFEAQFPGIFKGL